MGENNPKNARLARLQERRAAIQARMDAHVIGGGPVATSLALIERMRAEGATDRHRSGAQICTSRARLVAADPPQEASRPKDSRTGRRLNPQQASAVSSHPVHPACIHTRIFSVSQG